MTSGPITLRQIDGETVETLTDFTSLGSKIIADGDCSHEMKRCLLLGRTAMTNLDGIWKKQGHHFANKGPYSQSYGFFPVVMYRCDSWTIDWVPKNWCFWTVVLEKALKSLLDCEEIKPVNPKRNQPWIFTGRTDAETEASTLWAPDAKSQFIGKDPDAGKDWGQEEKGTTEGEMVGWHHCLNGHEFEQTLGDSEGQGGLVCCSPWGCNESDTI